MMRLPSRIFLLFVCLLISAPVWAQTNVFVTTGNAGTVLSVSTSTGTATTVLSTAGADYESIAIIPNNDPANTTGSPAFFVVVCDPTNNTITRVNSVGATDVVYAGGKAGPLQKPQCGRVDSAGDLIVSSEVPGSGAWKISGVAAVPFPSATAKFSAPAQLNTAISPAQVGQGVTQKVGGDLLVVDQAGNQVVRSAIQLPASKTTGYSFSGSTPFINGNLTKPVGIARDTAGLIYVSEHTSNKKGDVQLFDATGTFTSTCVTQSKLGNQQPNSLGVAEDGTLFVATAASSSGGVWKATQSAGTCTATQIASTSSPLSGIAVPPIPISITLSQPAGGTLSYEFGSSLYELTSGGTCNVTVQKLLVPTPQLTNLAATVSGMTTLDGTNVTLFGGVDTPYLSDGGFGTKYMLPDSPNPNCGGTSYDYLIAANVDQDFFPNPWIIKCDPAGTDTKCVAADLIGIYFIGGFFPGDLGTRSGGGGTSDFFLANMNLNAGEQGAINLESPLNQVFPPALAGSASSGSNLSVKFKFTPAITDAVAIISVAQVCQPGAPSNDPVCGPNGQASVFPIIPIPINSEGNSTTPPPVIKADSNQQYQFSLSLKGYAQGIYSLTIIPLSNNAPPLTVLIRIN